MKLASLLFIFLLVVFGYIFWYQRQAPTLSVSPSSGDLGPTPVDQKGPSNLPTKLLFVPYWGIGSHPITANEYDELIYFGISADTNGLDTSDLGYKNLALFTKTAGDKPTLLTVRMVDTDTNSKVLDDKNLQQTVIDQSVQVASDHHFSGIVLDFEIKALAFDSVVKNISSFYESFAKKTKAVNLRFYSTLYGDTFYRLRPYNVNAIAVSSDGIFIMTYDFHKAGGNPGPNFPLSGKDTYGYDVKTMISDFEKQAPAKKLSVVFGLFGYDWTVDDQNHAVKTGEPISYIDIKKRFLDSCKEKNCTWKKDTTSAETEIQYTGKDDKKHIIWFEDSQSMEEKSKFLKEKGILSTSIWAYSYY